MVRHALIVLALVAGSLVSTGFAADPREDLYRQALHILGGNASVIHKWQGPVRMIVVGSPSMEPTARQTLTEVTSIAGIEARFPSMKMASVADYLERLRVSPPHSLGSRCGTDAETEECFNFVIVFAASAEMEQIAGAIPLPPHFRQGLQRPDATPCYFAPYIRARHEIYRAMIYIRSDLSPDLQNTCLSEEIYQSMGMFEDYSDSKYFSFNNRVEPKRITAYDKALLKALYDPRVQLGTPANSVVRIFLAHHLP